MPLVFTWPLHGEVYTEFQPLSVAGAIPGCSTSMNTTGYVTARCDMLARVQAACCCPQAYASAAVPL